MSKQLESIIDLGVSQTEPLLVSLPWENQTFYGTWLVQSYKFVCHSAPLLKKAAESLKPGPFRELIEQHYREEVGHEKYAARDAKFFGRDAKAEPTLKSASKLYEQIYENNNHFIPALFGYATALEHLSAKCAPMIAERVTKAYKVDVSDQHAKNIPASFITLHAEVDQDHVREGEECLNYLNPDELDHLCKVAQESFSAYQVFLKEVKKLSMEQDSQVA